MRSYRLFAHYCMMVLATCEMGRGFLTDYYIDSYKRFNDVPSSIYYGLMTGAVKPQKVELVNGTCLQYDPHEFDRCSYYSDCCPFVPVRVMEQLPLGTFSCHGGYYIVDRCPRETTDSVLQEKCETKSASGLELAAWPVTSTINQLTYKNVYCAMCHGLDPDGKISLKDMYPREENVTIPAVEWWASKIQCELQSITEYLENGPDHTKLIQLIERSCNIYYIPARVPDLCWKTERFCPPGTADELTRLCEEGPASYVQHPSTGLIYRNQFCFMCKFNTTVEILSELIPAHTLAPLDSESLEFSLHSGRLQLSNSRNTKVVLAVVKITHDNHNIGFLTRQQRKNFQSSKEYRCTRFVDESLNSCNVDEISYIDKRELSAWNLGSFLCQSSFGKVCDILAIRRGKNKKCGSLGCDKHSLPELNANTCMKVNPALLTTSKKLMIPWQWQQICDYYSQCRAVDLGLMSETDLNCYCDEFCAYFNDCCEDSEYQSTDNKRLEMGTYSCRQLQGYYNITSGREWGVMAIDKCPKNLQLPVDGRMRELCEREQYEDGFLLARIPVTSLRNQLVYKNVYCALCNNVTDVQYWRVDMGVMRVANDSCFHVLNNKYNADLVFRLRLNPSIQTLKAARWQVKQYLPPVQLPRFRGCSSPDTVSYVDSCPEPMKNTVYQKLCTEGPASFVYDSMIAENYIKYMDATQYSITYETYGINDHEINLQKFRATKVYRNSYCATCNDALMLGCRAINAHVTGREQVFETYVSSPKLYLLVFRVDMNDQTCERLSDGRAVYGITETGWDTCINITELLRSCNDTNEIYNLESERCEEVTPGTVEIQHTSTNKSQQNLIAHKVCEGQQFEATKLNLSAAVRKCNLCRMTNSCTEIPASDTDHASTYKSIHCMAKANLKLPPTCNSLPLEDCNKIFYGIGDFPGGQQIQEYRPVIKFDNFVSIRYQHVRYSLSIEYPDVNRLGQLFTSYRQSNEPICTRYGEVGANDTEYLICDDRSVSNKDGEDNYPDYQLRGYMLELCVEQTKAGLYLAVYDYILSICSISAGLAFIIHGLVKQKLSNISSYMAMSTILAIIGSLICYCFINLSVDSSTACLIIALLSQYFFLSVHSWSNAWALVIARGILVSTPAGKQPPRRLAYTLYAWLSPLLFTVVSLTLHYSQAAPFYPVVTQHVCFVAAGPVRALVFTGPIYMLLLINLIICGLTSIKVLRSGRNLRNTDRQRSKRQILTVVKLQVILGLHWILLYIAEIPGPQQTWLWEVVTVLIALQALLLVAAQLLNMENLNRFTQTVRLNVRRISTSTSLYQFTHTDVHQPSHTDVHQPSHTDIHQPSYTNV